MNGSFSNTAFYVVAHADDWQLFMQPKAYKDLIAKNTKTVFIITTSGDAGLGQDYSLAREEGLISSITYCLAPVTDITLAEDVVFFLNHAIKRTRINHQAIVYFLRLPDGGLNGLGFKENNGQSLLNFKEGRLNHLTAIDGSACYKNFDDLAQTLKAIISAELGEAKEGWLNYLNPDPFYNPGDHPDHLITGLCVQQMQPVSNLKQRLYVGYSTKESSKGLLPKDKFWKTAIFAAYDKTVFDKSGYSTLREGIATYTQWCSKAPRIIEL